MSEYDVIVIGGGAVAENVADRAVQGGLSVVIVERDLVGGECSYWACMPSKGLLRAGATVRAARDVGGAAQAVTGVIDAAGLFARRNRITHDWNDESQVAWLHGAGIELLRGTGRITGEREVTVEAADGEITVLRARHAVVISVGSDPLLPAIEGLAEVEPWSSRDATSASVVPRSLAVIGGGVVAAEMATVYASLGTRVTVLARGGILRGMEPFAGEAVIASLEGLGATVRLGVEVVRARRDGAGTILETDEGDEIVVERVLVATGRVPRTQDLGLETIGLEVGAWLDTDDTLRVHGHDWLYATGDVTRRALLTHQGKYQARAAGDVIAARARGDELETEPWGRHVATADHAAVPQLVFTDPEVAAVGLTADAAERAGYEVRAVDYDMSWLAGATVHSDDYRGTARLVVDEKRKVVLGATFVGRDVGELLHSATIAIVGEVPIDRLWHAVPSYPTLSEVWLRFLEEYGR